MPRAQSIAETFRIAKQATLDATHRLLVDTAKREDARVMNTDPRPSRRITIVDGVQGASFESAKSDGIIIVQYPRIDEVVRFAMDTLFDLSPVRSGEYRRSHQLFVNGRPAANLKDWQQGQEVAVTNLLPYSRTLEIGKMRFRAPGGYQIYRRVQKKVSARFGNQFEVDFTYRALIGGQSIPQEQTASRGRWRKGGVGARIGVMGAQKSSARFPALIITER